MQRDAISKTGPDDIAKKGLQVEKGGSFHSNPVFEAWGGEKTAGETKEEQPLKQEEKIGTHDVRETGRAISRRKQSALLDIAKSSNKIQADVIFGFGNRKLVNDLDKSSVSGETGTESHEIR